MRRSIVRIFWLVFIFFLILGFCERRAKAEIHSWVGKITEAKEELSGCEPEHSAKLITYKETRKLPLQKGRKKSRTITIKRTDYAWKEACLALMNAETGEIKLVKIKKDNQKLWNQKKEFAVEIESRVNGITWNGRNTAFRVIGSPGWTVVANKWTERVNGKPMERIYFPYSTATQQEELVNIGGWHLEFDVEDAFAELRFKDVKSLALSEKGLSEVVPRDFPINIVLVEQTDPQEFYAFKSSTLKYNPFDRVKVLLAGNGEEAFPAVNYAGAVGLTQFTNNRVRRRSGTWDTVRKAYPTAELPEFRQGATNHTESLKAAILLYDYNLDKFIGAFGLKILDVPNLDLYLYAAHNCGISRVVEAIKQTKPGRDWRIALRKLSKTDETNIFLDKVDFLKTGGL